MQVKVIKRQPRPDVGPDLLAGVSRVRVDFTPNALAALLVVLDHVDPGNDDRTLAGELASLEHELYQGLGCQYGADDVNATRYQGRDDLGEGMIYFRKGGAHI